MRYVLTRIFLQGWEIRKDEDHLEDLGVDGRIIQQNLPKLDPPIYRKPGQTKNKFRNEVISYVELYFKPENYLTRKRNNFLEPFA
jgi:hypothetical protein